MKKFTFSMLAVMAIGTFAIAESYDAQGSNSYQAKNGIDSSFAYGGGPYVGIGYSYMNVGMDAQGVINRGKADFDIQGDNITLLMGYNINEYFAIEGRYSKSVNDLELDLDTSMDDKGMDWGGDMSNIALYLKPMYVSSKVTLYGLLGVGHTKIDFDPGFNTSDTKFQWGLGISFDAGFTFIGNKDVTFFMDYTRFDQDDTTIFLWDEILRIDGVIDSLNVGMSYKF